MSEQFENSIRKKLEEADVPFDPAAWEDMKKRLDDSDRRRPVFWWWTSGLLLLLLLSAAGGWWYAQQEKTTVPQNNVTATVEKNTAPQILPTPNSGSTSNLNEKENSPTNSGITTNISATPNNTGASKNVSAPVNKIQPTIFQKDSKQASTNNTPTSITEPTNNQITDVPFNQLQKTTEPKTADTVNNSQVINNPVQQIPDTTANTYTNVDNPKDSTQTKKKKRGFEGGITLGPDYNIAPSFKMGNIGFNGGLLLRYHVNNRLNISVAAIYEKKIYGATPKDYKFDYPVNYFKIEANCDVLDVPLNVHYKFLDQPKSSWSLMAGASSYFMLKEKYDYYWPNNTKRTREFSNKNQHYFSVLNFGVTWEKKTAGRLKWGIQPYVKVPMAGVGEGKVKLSSAGVSLQVMLGKKD